MARTTTFASLLLLLGGCAGDSTTPGALPSYRVGPDTVTVAPYGVVAVKHPDLAALTATATLIVTGRVVATDEIAYQVQPSTDAEGVADGEGPDLYGVITFEVATVVKGQAKSGRLRLVYESGKRDGQAGASRIAYAHEGLEALQTQAGGLKAPHELAGRTFVVFAAAAGYPAAGADLHALAHPYGIAQLSADGALAFPVLPFDKPAQPTLTDVTAAVT